MSHPDPEERLARLRDDANWNQLPEPELRIPTPRRRSRVGLLTTAAASAVILLGGAVALQAVNRTSGTPSHNTPVATVPHAIAWHATAAHAGAITLTGATSAPPACPPSALHATVGGGGGAGGTFYIPVSIRNQGHACTLHDHQVSMHWLSTGKADVTSTKVRLLPHGAAQTYRLALPTCTTNTARANSPVRVSLGKTPVSAVGPLAPRSLLSCGTASVQPNDPVSAQDAGTGPYSALVLSLQLPATISAGVMKYTVTMRNTGNAPFMFGNCPTYTELVGVGAQLNDETYTLSCSGMAPIPAGKAQTFDMQIHVPAGHGPVKVAWLMDGGPSQTAASTIG